jgi:hypothetical protein
MGRESKKATLNYANRGGKVGYKGKTKSPEKKPKEPTQQGKRFTIHDNSIEVCRPTKKEKTDTE